MKERTLKYDMLRDISCLAIVLLHVSGSYWYVVDVQSSDFVIMTMYNSITRFAVPCFFMLSGLFMVDPERDLSVEKCMRKIGKLLRAFFIWSAFYAFQSVIFHGISNGFGNITGEMWKSALMRLVNGHGHMWFVMDLLGFYLLTPVLRRICADIKILGYFLFLWVLFRFVLESILGYMQLGLAYSWVNHLHLHALLGYIGYYLTGYYLSRVEIPKKARIVLYSVGILAVAAINGLTIFSSRNGNPYNEEWLMPSSSVILIFSVAVFVFFANMKNTDKLEKYRKPVTKLSGLTFFVYMAHPFFVEKLNLMGINTLSFSPILSVPVLTIVVFLACVVCGWIVSRIPVIGKWITL